ncbi:hypothetical protein [Mangrovicoccus ximenensis]|uniref:hypothetical protein n=1 Tax=Mangrovicoccus ximenensis TaxID=1911570 RepID=UPI0011AE5B95|nr:hypothetical protein [Mangrovicoccus ximenensis]
MPGRHRIHGIGCNLQIVAERHGSETLHAPGRCRDLSRNRIGIWIGTAEAAPSAMGEHLFATASGTRGESGGLVRGQDRST